MRGGDNTAMAVERLHNGPSLGAHKGYRVVDCLECGFAHILPLPPPEELDRIYRDEYFTLEKPDFIRYAREDREWWNVVYDERLDGFESMLSGGKKRLLDVGCGPGFFLKRAAKRGWRCLGVEPSKEASAHAKGLGVNVINGFFNGRTMGEEGLAYDAVHISEVLEHVADPLAVLEDVYGLLDDGGLVCAVSPNDFSPVQKVLRRRLGHKPYWISVPHHINYFSFESMKALLIRAGFSIARVRATFPMDFFLLMGKDYVGDDALGRECHKMRTRLDIMLTDPGLKGFKDEMYALMASHNIGREFVIYGVKGRVGIKG